MIKKKDLMLISYLRNDARMSLTDMSRKTNIPVSTLFDRLRANEQSLIVKHTSLIDFSRLGYNVRANVTIKVDRDSRDALRGYLMKHPQVNSLFKINNGFDFLIEGIFRQLKDMEEFLEVIESRFKILDHKSFFIIEDLKREEFLKDADLMGHIG